jgi:hypothetical protein
MTARPHTVAHILETIRKLKWKVMEHPVHSSDFVPSDFHLFGPLNEVLGGRRFQYDEDVKNAVCQWLCAQPETFDYDGIKKLIRCWEKYAEKHGDYVRVEKLCILFL